MSYTALLNEQNVYQIKKGKNEGGKEGGMREDKKRIRTKNYSSSDTEIPKFLTLDAGFVASTQS